MFGDFLDNFFTDAVGVARDYFTGKNEIELEQQRQETARIQERALETHAGQQAAAQRETIQQYTKLAIMGVIGLGAVLLLVRGR